MPKSESYILLVEDSRADARIIFEILRNLNWKGEIEVLTNGSEVIPFLQKRAERFPRLIILDLLLPDISGHAVLKSLKTHQNYKNIPVLVQSGYNFKNQAEKCFKLGARWYIKKSFELDLMESEFEKVIKSLA